MATHVGMNKGKLVAQKNKWEATGRSAASQVLVGDSALEPFPGCVHIGSDEFFDLVSLEASGTYMNGYMVIDAETREIGLVEMSYQSLVYAG